MKSTKLATILALVSSVVLPLIFKSMDHGFSFNFSTLEIIGLILKSLILFTLITHVISAITKQKKHEKEAFNLIPQSILIYKWNGDLVFINKYAQEMFGYDLKNVMGRNVLEFISDKDKQRTIITMKENYERKKIINPINNYSIKNSLGVEIETTVHSALYSNNEIIVTILDDSVIDSAKKLYSDQIQFFWSLLNDLPVAMAFLDKEGKHKFINKYYLAMFGLRETDMLGKQLMDFVDYEEFERINKKIQYVLESNKELKFNEFITINTTKKVVAIDIVPRVVGNGGVFLLIRDISSESVKNNLLKKELLLNKTLSAMAENLSSINAENSYTLIDQSLKSIREALGASRCYIINKMDNSDFEISYENVVDGLKPYEGFTIDMSEKEKQFYNKFLDKKNKLAIPTVSVSNFNGIKHFVVFKSKSILEVSLPKTVNNSGSVLGLSSDEKFIKWTESDIEFLSAAHGLISSAISILKKVQDLRLSEETLNTLLDKTDIGIVIANITNSKILYINDRIKEIFKYDPMIDGDTYEQSFIIDNLLFPEEVGRIKEAFKVREYKGSFSGTVKIKTVEGKPGAVKVYSSRIEYEGVKAYLTTVVDVSEYSK